MSTAATTQAPETVVWRWVGAFNDRRPRRHARLPGRRRGFHPLKLHGLDGSYDGHDAVRRLFAQLERRQHHHRLALSRISSTGRDRVLAVGALRLNGLPDGAPFCGLYVFADGLIVAAHHDLTEPNLRNS